MQIILISLRTLGASEFLLLPSLFSHLFFSPLFVFLLLLLLFLKSFPLPPLSPPSLHRCHLSLSFLFPSGLVVGVLSRGSFIAAWSTWPNPLQMPDPEEGEWEVWAERTGWGGRFGVLVPLFGISVSMGWSQALSL